MRILRLEILNLASLDSPSGEVIDFEKGALKNSNIFSIVGPTGSGKSTILDAICLALYNRAPRYPKKKGDRNQTIKVYGETDEVRKNQLAPTDGRNILSQGKKAGYSKLTFIANNGYVYCAEWHVAFKQKAYDDVLTKLTRFVIEDGETKPEEVDWTDIPKIIGLDYEEFLRTVLIAQGSFANFLISNEDERYQLLEKLVGCEEMYKGIAARIKEEKDKAVAKYEAVNGESSLYQQKILSEEQLQQTNERIAVLEEKERKRQEQRDAIIKATAIYKESEEARNNVARLNQTLVRIGGEEKKKADLIVEEENLLVVLTQKADEATTEYERQKPHIDAARGIMAELKVVVAGMKDKEATMVSCGKALTEAERKLGGNRECRENAKELFEAEESRMKQVDTAELQNAKSRAEKSLHDIGNAIRIIHEGKQKKKESVESEQKLEELEKKSGEISEKLKKINLAALEQELQTLQKTYTLMTSQDWAMHRSMLKEGEPCPLCGAKEHPYCNEGEVAAVVNELSDLLQNKKLEVDGERKKREDLVKEQGVIKGSVANMKISVDRLNKELDTLRSQWRNVNREYPDWLPNEELLAAKEVELKAEAAKADGALKAYNELCKWVERLRYEKEWNERKEAYDKAKVDYSGAAEGVENKRQELRKEIGDEEPEAMDKRLIDSKEKAVKNVADKREAIGKTRELIKDLQGQQKSIKETIKIEEEKGEKAAGQLEEWIEKYDTMSDISMTVEEIALLYRAGDNWEEVCRKLGKMGDNPDESKEELTNLRVCKKNHDEAEKRLGELLVQREKLSETMKEWQEIYDAIGGSDGKVLRRIAQCYTLHFLVEHANAEIRKFNNRYELMHVRNSLGIRIIDHHRADVVRDTTSLSGGETFIVSLGLALGLSSLSSRNVRFENLFIDEGFGTLDPDTLGMVIDSLSMLQSSQGKKVGVISHTDIMKERITTQICLIKNGDSGSSHIEIKPY